MEVTAIVKIKWLIRPQHIGPQYYLYLTINKIWNTSKHIHLEGHVTEKLMYNTICHNYHLCPEFLTTGNSSGIKNEKNTMYTSCMRVDLPSIPLLK